MFRFAFHSQSVWALLCVVLLAGCPAPNEPLPSATDDEQPPADSSQKIEATLASWEAIEKSIAGHRGKVVVVDLWKTDCEPCKREFPHLVELHNASDPEKVACVAVSLDYYGDKTEPPDSYRPAVEAFLEETEAKFPNYICTDADEVVYTKLQAFGVPIVLVYGPDGELAKAFTEDGSYGEEGFTYHDHIEPLAEQLQGPAN